VIVVLVSHLGLDSLSSKFYWLSEKIYVCCSPIKHSHPKLIALKEMGFFRECLFLGLHFSPWWFVFRLLLQTIFYCSPNWGDCRNKVAKLCGQCSGSSRSWPRFDALRLDIKNLQAPSVASKKLFTRGLLRFISPRGPVGRALETFF
jgi:hypothetical protein